MQCTVNSSPSSKNTMILSALAEMTRLLDYRIIEDGVETTTRRK
jgi:hypothetical protein